MEKGGNRKDNLCAFQPPITWSRIDKSQSYLAILSNCDEYNYHHLRFCSRRFPRTPPPGRSITSRYTSCQTRRVPSGICDGKCRLSEPPSRRSAEELDQPNLTPPIVTTDQALEYKATLEKIDPETEFLMTLYLSPDLTPDEVRKAKAAGIVGMSSTVNSSLFSCSPRSQIISKRRHN